MESNRKYLLRFVSLSKNGSALDLSAEDYGYGEGPERYGAPKINLFSKTYFCKYLLSAVV